MSGFFWNVRGFNKSIKHSVVKKWVQDQGFQFGALLETRVKEGRSQRISDTVFKDWNLMSNYEFNPLGRIWLVWRPEVRITPFYKTAQMITVSVALDEDTEEFFYTCVYALNTELERRELWSDLKAHQDSPIIRQKAWIITGDFNEILDAEEHSMYGVRSTVSQGMYEFQEAVQHCKLLDLAAHGPQFTWTNKREEGLISKKLDRVLINDHWFSSYPQSYSVFEGGGCSDHLRCRIQLRSSLTRPKRPFKFVNAVAELEGFKPLIEDHWQNTEPIFLSTSSLYRFSKKLKALKPKIRVLAKEQMGNLSLKAKEAYENLCRCQEENIRNPTQGNLDRENSAYKRWEHVASLEEGFLKQKSKLHWLKVGDKNNKVFHRAATTRDTNNSIKEIKCRDGRIVKLPEEIKEEAEGFFKDFLQYVPPDLEEIDASTLSDLLPYRCSVTDQQNLTQVVTAEEITKYCSVCQVISHQGQMGSRLSFSNQHGLL